MRHFSTKTLLAATMAVAISAPAFAMGGNITGSEYGGEPLNSSVHSPARNPETGLTPGGERSHGIRPGTRSYGQVHNVKRRVCWSDDLGRRHCRWR